MDDLISRKAAIDAVKKNTFRLTFAEEQNCEGHVAWSAEAVYSDVIEGALLELPSAQPETHEERTETHSCDLISRQAAIDAILAVTGNSSVRELYEHVQEHGLSDMWSGGVNAAIDIIIAVPSAQSEPKWIPVSERLPEEYGEYRITWTTSCSKKRFIGDAEYEIITYEWDAEQDRFKGEWILEDYIKYYPDVKVIAWKPLEEPYKGEGD